jgi:hypothetical protein
LIENKPIGGEGDGKMETCYTAVADSFNQHGPVEALIVELILVEHCPEHASRILKCRTRASKPASPDVTNAFQVDVPIVIDGRIIFPIQNVINEIHFVRIVAHDAPDINNRQFKTPRLAPPIPDANMASLESSSSLEELMA